jgi:hypothetical protein
MAEVAQWAGGALALLIAAIGGLRLSEIIVARMQRSGGVRTSEAETLWNVLTKRLDNVEAQLAACQEGHERKDAKIDRLEEENLRLRQEIDRLRDGQRRIEEEVREVKNGKDGREAAL